MRSAVTRSRRPEPQLIRSRLPLRALTTSLPEPAETTFLPRRW